jgi:rare lipoprotein A (peptidoglycan hydrolase)
MQTLVGGASCYDPVNGLGVGGKKLGDSAMNAAMPMGKLGAEVTVSLMSEPEKSVIVTVISRGPYERGRVITLTSAAFRALTGSLMTGVVQVKVVIA